VCRVTEELAAKHEHHIKEEYLSQYILNYGLDIEITDRRSDDCGKGGGRLNSNSNRAVHILAMYYQQFDGARDKGVVIMKRTEQRHFTAHSMA
jgi:hypothetical protein